MSASSPIDVASTPGSDIILVEGEYAIPSSTRILLTPNTPNDLPDALFSTPLLGSSSQLESSAAESSAAGGAAPDAFSAPQYDLGSYNQQESAAESSAAGSRAAVESSSTLSRATAAVESSSIFSRATAAVEFSSTFSRATASKRPREEEASCRRSKRGLPRPEYDCRKALDRLFQQKRGETSLGKKKTWKKKAARAAQGQVVPPVGVNLVVKTEPATPPEPVGLSLSVTPPCWVDEKPDVGDGELPPIEIRNAGSRGRGLYALRAFHPGDVIYAETPLITARKSDSDAAILDKILALPLDKMRILWQLETSGGYQPMVRGLFDANTIPCHAERDTDLNGEGDDDDEDEPEDGIFEYISRINHSCSPNAGWYWSNRVKKLLLVASQAVDVGDELVATYMDPRQLLMRRSDRKKVIESISGFKCSCPSCSVNYSAQSDTNRARLAQLFKGWEAPNIHKLVVERDILSRLHEAAQLARAEGLESLLLDVFLHEFYVLAAWKKEARAKQVAGLALDALQRSRGRDEASDHFVARFAADPKSWASYGFMTR